MVFTVLRLYGFRVSGFHNLTVLWFYGSSVSQFTVYGFTIIQFYSFTIYGFHGVTGFDSLTFFAISTVLQFYGFTI